MKKESLSRKLTLGIFYLLSSSFVSLGLNVIIVGFIARKLDVENFGLYSAILAFVGLFQFLSDFGLNKTLLKAGSTDLIKAQIGFGNALYLKSILALPLLLLVTFLGFLAGYRNENILILILFSISLIFDSYAAVFSSIRRILGSFKLISFFRVLRTAINLLIIVIALSIENSILSLALANALLSFVIFIISLINTILLLKPKVRPRLINEFFKDSVIFSFSDFFLNIYARISTVLLSFFDALHSVGIYSAALRFTRVANLLPRQVKFALLPTMYRILEDQRIRGLEDQKEKKEQKVFSILLKYMIIFATPVAFSICFFSQDIIHLIFSKRYDSAIPFLRIFSLFIYLRFIETPFTLFYISLNQHKTMTYLQGITSLVNLILNLIFIPKYLAYGACYATLISEVFLAFTLIIVGRKYLIWKLFNVIKTFIKPTFAGCISIGIVSILLSKTNVFIQVFSLLSLYLIILLITKVFNEQDKRLFKKILSNKQSAIIST